MSDACCPRCGGHFVCGAQDAAPCPCTTVRLTPQLQAQLRDQWRGCLCLSCLTCLTQLAAGTPPTAVIHMELALAKAQPKQTRSQP